MADVNARAGGTLNQDPFSVNMSDGVGQGQEPEISPTAPDDDLNKNADELEYLNDTDHSTMLNETNLIQSMQETLAANDSGDHEFRGDYQSMQASVEAAVNELSFLNKYKRKILAVGISSNDVMALESRYPKVLVSVGNGFTLESNDSNKEVALEAINELIQKAIEKARAGVTKLIEWLTTRFKEFSAFLEKKSLDQHIARFGQRLKLSHPFYPVNELAKKLPNVDEWNQHQVTRSLGQKLGANITLDKFSGVVNSKDPKVWIAAIDQIKSDLKNYSADKAAIFEYGNELLKLSNSLKEIRLDNNIVDNLKRLDEQVIALEAKSPFDPEKSCRPSELFAVSTDNFLEFNNTLIKRITPVVGDLTKDLNNMKNGSDLSEDILKVYTDAIMDVGKCLAHFLIRMDMNYRMAKTLIIFVDFATWSCDSVNGMAGHKAKKTA